LLDHFSPGAPARLVGHSMGGNVVWLYAGIRPERVSHAVSIDAAGLPDTAPAEAPDRYARWLDQLRNPAAFAPLDDHDAVLALVRKLAPGLDQARADFMAAQWARPHEGGGWRLPHDPRHKHVNPVLYRRAEAQACWRRIRAHTLLILARDARTHARWHAGVQEEIMACIPHLAMHVLDCGHMVQLEAPESLAAILDAFLA
jgi:pimeloyl-ACP methyl ester carboxylesterase